MTWIDWFIIGIIVISSLISVMRGFVKEALSLAAWIVAFVIAWRFNGGMVSFLQGFIANKNLQFIVGFVFLFVLTMLMFAVVTYFASKLIQRTGLTGTDRAIGVLFGFARGLVLVTALVALAGLTTLPKSATWHNSVLTGRFQYVAVWLTGFLPEDIAKNFIFK
jgi:membrane protein required for colicin V production